jgi:hypothetical protein
MMASGDFILFGSGTATFILVDCLLVPIAMAMYISVARHNQMVAALKASTIARIAITADVVKNIFLVTLRSFSLLFFESKISYFGLMLIEQYDGYVDKFSGVFR